MKKKKIRSFDEEFKRAAVARLHQGEAPVRIAFDLKIPRKLLYDWKRRVRTGQAVGRSGETGAAQTDGLAWRSHRLSGALSRPTYGGKPFFHSALRKLEVRKANDPGNEPSALTSANNCGREEF